MGENPASKWFAAYKARTGHRPEVRVDPTTKDLYIWEHGVWVNMTHENAEQDLMRRVVADAPGYYVTQRKRENLYLNLAAKMPLLGGARHVLRRGATTEEAHPWANFTNGVLNLQTGELMPHGEPWNTRNQIPHNYLDDINADELEGRTRYVHEQFCMLLDSEEEANLLWAIIGTFLLPGQFSAAIYILTGKKGSGKSSVVRIIEKLLGQGNISSKGVHDLDGQFAKVELYDKLLNISNETSGGTVARRTHSLLLTASGGDYMDSNRKGRTAIRFRYSGKFLIVTNEPLGPPPGATQEDGWYRRAYYLRTPRTIENPMTDEEATELLTQDMDAVATRAARAVMAEVHSDTPPLRQTSAMRDLLEDTLSVTSTTYAFRCDRLRATGDDTPITGKRIWDAYQDWCAEAGHKGMGRNTFYQSIQREIEDMGGYRENKPRDRRGAHVFRGVQLTEEGGKEESRTVTLIRRNAG